MHACWEHVERDETMNPASHHGRIAHKIIFELLYDLVPNYCYDSVRAGRITTTKSLHTVALLRVRVSDSHMRGVLHSVYIDVE